MAKSDKGYSIEEDKNDFYDIIPTLLFVGEIGYAIGAYNNKKK